MAETNGTTLYHPSGHAFVRLTERELGQYEDTIGFLQERIGELEASLSGEDAGWQRLSGEDNREFSRDYLRRIAQMARVAFLRNPLINRAVTLQAFYVWGQGVSIEARHPDVDAVVQSFLDDPKNQAELTSHQARALKEMDLQVEGNIFFAFFVTPASGRVRIRTIPPDQVADIVTNPDDAKDAWFYKRVWTPRTVDGMAAAQQIVYYPDWRHTPSSRPDSVAGKPIDWVAPVYHVKVGGLSDMRFGVPEVYAAIDWAKAYKSFLEDWATIVRALSRFAWNLTTKGGKDGVAGAKAKLGTTLGVVGGRETNPPPTTGSAFIGQDGVKLDPIRTSGATTSAEDGRRLLLMVAAATGMPESFFGDVSVGTLATAKSLDRPTELKFADRRTLWSDVLKDIFAFVIEHSVRAPSGGLRGTVASDDGRTVVTLEDDPETGEPIDQGVDIKFPPILEHSVTEQVDAIVKGATLGASGTVAGTIPMKFVSRLLLSALSVEDTDELLAEWFPDEGASTGDTNAEDVPPQPDQSVESQMVEAVKELRSALREVVK